MNALQFFEVTYKTSSRTHLSLVFGSNKTLCGRPFGKLGETARTFDARNYETWHNYPGYYCATCAQSARRIQRF